MLEIRTMQEANIPIASEAFANNGIYKCKDYLTRYWQENLTGERITLLAFYQDQFAGSVHLLTKSYYPYFVENKIPEINDFNVIPPLRRLGIGKAPMDAVEKMAFDK
jgi:GNAT superfamily N-acetyltransferase